MMACLNASMAKEPNVFGSARLSRYTPEMSSAVKSPPSLRLGAHVSIAGGFHRALERGAELGCQVVQIFTSSNQQWRERPLADEEVEHWKHVRRATRVEPVLVHGSYLVNLGSPDATLWEKSFQALAHDYARCSRLGVEYLVIHPGAHLGSGEAAAIDRIARALDRLHHDHPENQTRVLLENTAGQGSSVGHRFEHLRDILAAVAAPTRLGVCIDTCHTFAAGYPLATARAWEATFSAFDRIVGVEQIRAFHVNDSKAALGARVDRHEQIGRGELGLSAFRLLVNDRRFAGLPMVIETPRPHPGADRRNLDILLSLEGRHRVTTRARALAAEL
jgi:deoxyribonuclease-4